MLLWLMNAIRSPQALVVRAERAFVVATLLTPPWRKRPPECHVLAVCAEPGGHWDAVRCLRESVAWARAQGCDRWRVGSETGIDVGAIAKRVGAVPTFPCYWIEL